MSDRRKYLFLCLFFISGASGLIYEVVWSRMLVFVFGGTTYAITTVLSCFMGGLALGSFLGGRLSGRFERPERMYGIIEILIGLYCLAIPYLLELAFPLYRVLIGIFGDSFSLLTVARVVVSSAILILPTTLMGATLPVLARAFVHRTDEMGGDTGRLYGFNTIGAFAGCVLVGFILLPSIGLRLSIYLAAFLNLLAGTAAVVLSGKPVPAPDRTSEDTLQDFGVVTEEPMNKQALLVLYGLSGFAAMAYQVSWVRALILSMGSSTYAFSAIVACFIFGLATGSLLISRWADRIRRPLGTAAALEAVIALSALFVVPLFGKMPDLVKNLSSGVGATFEGVLIVEVFCVFGLLIVPTLAMGALLPLMCRLYDPRPPSVGRSVGNVYASNTLGNILGTLAAGFVLIPGESIGMERTIMIASAISGVVGTVFLISGKSYRKPLSYAAVCTLWILGFLFSGLTEPWSKEAMVSGPYLGRGERDMRVLYYREDVDTTVAVAVSGNTRTLLINGKPDASTSWVDRPTQYLLAHIPLLLKPDAEDVCVIGLGAGGTASAALTFPVKRVDVAEISSAVIDAVPYFMDVHDGRLSDPRVHIVRADGRNFLLLGDRKYDVIISEPPNVWMSGVANLFTREFFEISRSRLRPGGIHGQWIHGYSLKTEDFASIVRTLNEVFPYVQLWEMSSLDFILVGSDKPITIDVEGLYQSFSRPEVSRVLSRILVNDPMQMTDHYVADGQHMKSWMENMRLLTDDLPYLEFSAPRYLLKTEYERLKETLYGMKGYPAFAGDSPLNGEFMEGIDNTRTKAVLSSRALDAVYSDRLAEGLEHLVQVARFGSTDADTVYNLVRTDIFTGDLLEQPGVRVAYEEILKYIPDFDELERHFSGSPAKLHWPFSRTPRGDVEAGMRPLSEKISRLVQEGRREQALALSREALKKHADNPVALFWAGSLSLELSRLADAIPYLLKSLAMNPGNAGTSYQLSRAYARRGDRERAIFYLEQAETNGFGISRIPLAEPDFQSLRNDERFRRLMEQDDQAMPRDSRN